MFEDDVTVPAGWYPDPMGLPQLRWWNNHAWTELTTEARAPVVMQQQVTSNPARRVLYADDEEEEIFPTRRQQREQREREEEYRSLATDEDEARDAIAGHVPLSTGLREIDAPVVDAPVAEAAAAEAPVAEVPVAQTPVAETPVAAAPEQAPVETPVAASSQATAPAAAPDRALIDEGDAGVSETFDDIFLPRSATNSVSSPFAQYDRERTADAATTRATTIPRLGIYTAPVWIIALLPLVQLVGGLLILLGIGAVSSMAVTIALLVAPYIVVILLAIADRAMLKRMGHEHTAHWAWAILSAPVYLIARSMALSRTGGLGLAPLLVWAALGMLQVASILVVPGMLISILPTVFSAQAEQSVSSEAAIIGADLTVTCPTPPPVLIGTSFTCSATSTAGHDLKVTVSLQRANGWIDWRVDDWGNTFAK
ncbi:MAG: hypothetical protein JWN36_3211 [Microbacteriaceae bacterium]|nr:hypothetical protein [Microbacteriaceae bacterium]